jgi:hypothetical protein
VSKAEPADTSAAAAAAASEAATEAPSIPRGYWEAADGSLVPVSKIKEVDKARDAVVRRLIGSAEKVSAELTDFKRHAMAEIDQFVALSAAQYGAVMRGAAGKGNVTLVSFDGRLKVEKQISDRIIFDERLQVAKQLIDDCIRRWGKNADGSLKVLVNHAFQVDKAGRVSVAKVMGLRAAKIEDPKWLQAMEAAADSLTVAFSVAYVRAYRRNDSTGDYVPISLNAAAA